MSSLNDGYALKSNAFNVGENMGVRRVLRGPLSLAAHILGGEKKSKINKEIGIEKKTRN